MDKRYSAQIHTMKGNKVVDCIVLVFGLMFNRAFCIIPVVISWLMARNYPQQVFGLLPGYVTQDESVNLFVVFVMLEIIVLLVITQFFKKYFKRQRPLYATANAHLAEVAPARIIEINTKEVGSYSIPSGDASQAALWCTLTQMFFSPILATPMLAIFMVSFARVYFRCHWIGDTIVGSILGITVGIVSYLNFKATALLLFQMLPSAIFKFTF